MYNILTPLRNISKSQSSLKYMVRFYQNRKKFNRTDPGIRRRKSLLDKTASQLEEVDYDDLETDFANLEMSHQEHVHEINMMKEKEKFLIVRQKYFKERFPNFLTWADKQQIKHLHNSDPEEWTIEKLSEGFPALPDTIKKVIKANWTKTSSTKIKNHDTSVSKNWDSFTSGELELPPDLSNHLNKFSNRREITNPVLDPVVKPEISLPSGEFSHIITSYEKLKGNDQPIKEEGDFREERKPLKEHYLSGPVTDIKQALTLDQYQRVLKNRSDLNDVDKQIVQHARNEDKVLEPTEEVKLDVVKYVNSSGAVSTFNSSSNCNHLIYPERIIIPKDKRKRGCTYKLSDCYYDDDGEFLYRVPGME